MTPLTLQSFIQHYELWIHSDRQGDVGPLFKAAGLHLRSGRYQLSEFAPCFAAIYFTITEFEYSRLAVWSVKFLAWLFQTLMYRGRPMWNDFWMVLWQLSRDPKYVHSLHRHLVRARDKRNEQQFWSGQWMVQSVCEQDSEFAEHWRQNVQAHGEVF